MEHIRVDSITKTYLVKQRTSGVLQGVKSFFHPTYNTIDAVKNVSFSVKRGEIVGYIGPNGAGKSTTLKLLSGILVPSDGKCFVNGLEPYVHRKACALKMGVVFGQRTQLLWDLPVLDALDLQRHLYCVSKPAYHRNLDLLIELLDMSSFMNQPARQLSLGQKMRANLAMALIYEPEVLFLDEPTIGLDILAKDTIRRFLKTINKELATTIMLTTHDMGDVEALCSRLIFIDHGSLLYDGSLESFVHTYSSGYTLRVEFADTVITKVPDTEVVAQSGNRVDFHVKDHSIRPGSLLRYLTNSADIVDVAVVNNSIEDILRRLYRK